MSSENNFEVKFTTGAVMKVLKETPEAAELALDELRRDPMNVEDNERLNEVEQNHGTDVLEYYNFFFQVINDSRAFFEIDFEPSVDDAVTRDTTQKDVEAEIISKFNSQNFSEDLTPAIVISRSKRAHMLMWVARLEIEAKLKNPGVNPKPSEAEEKAEDLELVVRQ